MKILRISIAIICIVANIAMFSILMWLLLIKDMPNIYQVDRTVYLDLSLSLLNMMVTILAIVLAIGAFWGYAALREAAEKKAEEVADRVARQYAKAYLAEDGSLQAFQALAALLRQNAPDMGTERERPNYDTEPKAQPRKMRPIKPRPEDSDL